MTRQNGTHVEYERPSVIEGREAAKIVRVFSTRVAALESAVENLNGAVYIEFGDTIEDALAKAQAAKVRKDPTGPGPSSGATATKASRDIPEGRP